MPHLDADVRHVHAHVSAVEGTRESDAASDAMYLKRAQEQGFRINVLTERPVGGFATPRLLYPLCGL